MTQVSEGFFTVELDFGDAAFPGADRWLQIAVITNGGSTVTTLEPRQPIHATPYAMHASQLGAGGLGATYSEPVSFTNAGNLFAGDGSGLAGLSATAITGGNLDPARMPTGGVWGLDSNLFIDSGVLTIDPIANRVGINTTSPGADLDVAGAGNFLLIQSEGDVRVAGSLRVGPVPNEQTILAVNATDSQLIDFGARTFSIATGTSPGNAIGRLLITPAGKVGMSADPDATGSQLAVGGKVDVSGDLNMDGVLRIGNVPDEELWISQTGTETNLLDFGANTFMIATGHFARLRYNSTRDSTGWPSRYRNRHSH